MHCFSITRRSRSRSSSTAASATPNPAETPTTDDEDQSHTGPASNSRQTSTNSTAAANSPTLTINLRREYTLAVQTHSYNEIWSTIHRHPAADLDAVLRPDRSSIQEAFSSARLTPLTRLVSEYFDSSERTSRLFLSLRSSVERALSLYTPVTDLLDLLPSVDDDPSAQLSSSQCDWAFDTFREFDKNENPFPGPDTAGDSGCSFDGMRVCFLELKQQLDSRLVEARRRQRILRCTTHSSAYCLLASAVAATVTGLVIATHALVALVAVGPSTFCCGDLLAAQRRQLREHIEQVDAAAREAYVLNNNLDTIERLVVRLHAAVESDKGLVSLVLARGKGKGQRHPIQEVVRHLRKNNSSFMHQLRDLDEHIVLCLAAVNRARSLLIQQIHC